MQFSNKDNNIIYGVHPIIEAIKKGQTFDKLLVYTNISNQTLDNIKTNIQQSGNYIDIQFVPNEKLDSLTHRANHQGVVGLVSYVDYYDYQEVVNELIENNTPMKILFLDHITDVRNFGAIVRSAECSGFDLIIIPSQGSAQINMDAIKTSAGAINRMKIAKSTNTKSTLNFLKQNNIKIYSASEKAHNIYYQVDMKCPICLILGSENKGVSNEALKLSDELIKIPMLGQIESLNVSVAAGILMFEVLRQRANN